MLTCFHNKQQQGTKWSFCVFPAKGRWHKKNVIWSTPSDTFHQQQQEQQQKALHPSQFFYKGQNTNSD